MSLRVLSNGDKMVVSGEVYDVEGYIQDPHNPKLWHPRMDSCSGQIKILSKKSCGAVSVMLVCSKIKQSISQLRCKECAPDGGEPQTFRNWVPEEFEKGREIFGKLLDIGKK